MADDDSDVFLAAPTWDQLNKCKKSDMFALAAHDGISVATTLLEEELKAAVVDGLVSKCLLKFCQAQMELLFWFLGVVVQRVSLLWVSGSAITPGIVRRAFTLPKFNPFSSWS